MNKLMVKSNQEINYQSVNDIEIHKRNKDEIRKYDVYENTKKKLNYIVISNDTQNKHSIQITVINSFDNEILTVHRSEILEKCNYLGELNSIEKEKLNYCIKKYFSK